MNSDRLVLRARTIADERFIVVVVALLVLTLLGGWLTYGALAGSNDAQSAQRTVEAWSTTGEFTHGAVVQTENEVWEVGTTLENRPVYFTDVSPELEGEFRHRYDAPAGEVTVNIELVRVVRAVGDEGEVHWSISEPLESTSAEGVGPGDGQAAAYDLNVSALEDERDRIEASVGQSPGTVETVIVAHVAMAGTIDGEGVDRTETYELRIDSSGDTYALAGVGPDRRVEERPEPVQASSSGGLLGVLVPLGIGVGALGALGTIVTARSRGVLAPGPEERARLAASHERAQFDDWVSEGSLPERVKEYPLIDVGSLEGLVDVAIDSDRRVLEDSDGYYVVDGRVLYGYRPSASTGEGDEGNERGDRHEPAR
ncbi:DUF5305 domain-containing protein [Saliphagus sp. GCM10025334]